MKTDNKIKTQKKNIYEQYWEIKEKHEDSLVLFEVGNFYQLYYNDAQIVSQEKGFKLIIRSLGNKQYTICAGVPLSSVDRVAKELVGLGYKIIICNRFENAESGDSTREVCKLYEPKSDVKAIITQSQKFFHENSHLSKDELKEKFKIETKEKTVNVPVQEPLHTQVLEIEASVREKSTSEVLTPEVLALDKLTPELLTQLSRYKEDEISKALSLFQDCKDLEITYMTILDINIKMLEWKGRVMS